MVANYPDRDNEKILNSTWLTQGGSKARVGRPPPNKPQQIRKLFDN
ncbi:hypothetical protein F4827_003342 [Paraburkholderia bannensis]|uniref:Uncharacterized protein n=1 Tax=Paraburkholderia bannensis TaxID=765414 RepID=A0A7W9TY09_9BURK|nr:hypothetical protein [Paraburkholderia sp. WP4_3_2]MBB6103487.1 hypothetical protein [Paraburkholderia bannensis]